MQIVYKGILLWNYPDFEYTWKANPAILLPGEK